MPAPFQRNTGGRSAASTDPGALLSALLEASRPHERMDWVRKDEDGKPLGTFVMQVLSASEVERAKGDAEKHVRGLLTTVNDADTSGAKAVNQAAWEDMYQSALAVELLYHACRDADDVRKTLFRTPDDIRDYMTSDEIAQLYDAYDGLQHRVGPLFRLLSDEELEWWIKTLEEGADKLPFGQLSHAALVQLIVSLGSLLRSLRIGTSSPGSESSDGSDTTNTASRVDDV